MIQITLPNGETVEVEADSIEEAEETVLDMIEMGELDTEVPSTLGEKIYGAGEAALTGISAGTLGIASGIGRTIGQAAREIGSGEFGSREAAARIQQASMEGMQAGTRMPKTQEGMETLQAFDELTKPLQALPPIMPQVAATGQLGMQARALGDIAGAAADPAIQKGVMAAQKVSQKVTDRFKKKPVDDFEGSKSIGAAETQLVEVRDSEAASLLVPTKLTEGEAFRDPDLLRQESQLMKSEGGAKLRDFQSERNKQLDQNFDVMIDQLESVYSTDKPMIGKQVVDVLDKEYKKMKGIVNKFYERAKTTGGLKEKVSMNPLAQYLNDNRAERQDGGIMTKLQRQIEVKEIGDGDFKNGSLVLGDISANDAEELIQFINRTVDRTDTRETRMGAALKNVIDEQTKQIGNIEYKKARKMRQRQDERFEDMKIITNLLGTKKDTSDRIIAIEKVLDKTVLSPATDNESLVFLKRALHRGGQEGKQAWNELQAGTIEQIRQRAFNPNSMDQQNQAFISAHQLRQALKPLLESGKAKTLFTPTIKRNLEMLQSVADTVATTPPGVINNSNTSSAFMTIIDMGLLSTGTLPVATVAKLVKDKVADKKLQKRIMQALRESKK